MGDEELRELDARAPDIAEAMRSLVATGFSWMIRRYDDGSVRVEIYAGHRRYRCDAEPVADLPRAIREVVLKAASAATT